MDGKAKKQFEVIREGFARARFGGSLSGCDTTPVGGPITFAAVENNAGLNPEEFFTTMARLLSQAVTPYRKFDFTGEGVLKSAVGLFEGLTLYANHWADVNDWKGLVQDCVWDETNTPKGINALLVIDKTIDPKLARGVEIKALRSVSVTIWFEYQKSHPDLANFYDRLGETVDGEMVRFVVTKITQAGEVSIVWEGEDPFAKTFEAGGGQEPPTDETNHTQTGGEAMKVSQKLAVLLALTVGAEIDEATLDAAVSGKIEALQSEVAGLKPDAAIGVQTLKETREKAVTLYKAAKGEKVVETFISGVIEKADLATARGLVQEYQLAVDESIPLACPKCGEKLSRRSSQPEEPNRQLSNKREDDYKLS